MYWLNINFLIPIISFCLNLLITNHAATADSLLTSSLFSSSNSTNILPVEDAFRLQFEVNTPEQLKLTFDIAPGTYLYRDRIEITLEDTKLLTLNAWERPPGELRKDAVRPDGSSGELMIYRNRVTILLPLQLIIPRSEPVQGTLKVKYQGCAEVGICYPPQNQQFTFWFPLENKDNNFAFIQQNSSAAIATPPKLNQANLSSLSSLSATDQLATTLANNSRWMSLLLFLGLGCLLAFTPCTFPLIPILAGMITGYGTQITTRRAFLLSLVYVLALAITDAIAGILAGLFGANLQASLQGPWILSIFALFFIMLALSMFGAYHLQLPIALQSRLTALSNRQTGGKLLGVAVMGVLAALIIGPCITPPLAGALLYIGQTGDAVFGGMALFALGLGMGIPLLILGTSAGKLLPRAGAWMKKIQIILGVILLGVALSLLERILPITIMMILWGLVLICLAGYLGAFNPISLKDDNNGWQVFRKGLGIAGLIYGALMLYGAAAGGRDLWQPLRGILGNTTSAQINFQRIKTIADLDLALVAARENKRPVLLDITATWCVTCQEIERNTFRDPRVIAELTNFIVLQADVSAQDQVDQILLHQRLEIPGPPAILLFTSSGNERRDLRQIGFVGPAELITRLRQVIL